MLLPSFAAALLPFALLPLPPAHWRPGPLLAAGVLAAALGVFAIRVRWEAPAGGGAASSSAASRSVRWAPSVVSFGYLAVLALLRASGGLSGVGATALLPVFWIGLYGTRRQLIALQVAIALLLVLPLVFTHSPSGAWRAAVLFVAVSGIVGATVQTLVARVRHHELERDQLLRRLELLAHTDPLTGLRNRRAWDAELARGLARAQRTGEPVSVAVIDIDNFKEINDRLGHAEGDSLLISLAADWTASLRPDDVLARLGGDEFALLMPGCGEGQATVVMTRLHSLMPWPHRCSAGLATWDGHEPAAELMRRGDEALYESKREGRETVAEAV